MKRRTGSVRLWAAAFWLLVWEGASLALAATTGGRMLLLASPVQALGRLLALAGTAAFWQAVAFSSLRILGGFLLACALAAVLAPLPRATPAFARSDPITPPGAWASQAAFAPPAAVLATVPGSAACVAPVKSRPAAVPAPGRAGSRLPVAPAAFAAVAARFPTLFP